MIIYTGTCKQKQFLLKEVPLAATHSSHSASAHTAFSRDDTFNSAETYLRIVASLEKLWAEKNGLQVMTAMTMLFRSARQGYETDITAFAAAMNIPRTSAHRMLNAWARKNYVVLERKGRKTIIHPTALTLDRLVKFFDDHATFFNVPQK